MLLLLYIVDNVNIFKMFNINVNCTDYMHKKCCETNYSLCRHIAMTCCDIILRDI